MRLSHSNYALAATAALSLGLGFSFWRATAENDRLKQAYITASVAVEAAQDEAKVLREKLLQEARERRRAEASQTVAENGERTARERLAMEMKAHEAAETRRAGAAARLTATLAKLGEAEKARGAAEHERDVVAAKLVEEQNERNALQSARRDAAASATLISARMASEIQAMKAAEAALIAANEHIRSVAALELGEEPKLCRVTPDMTLGVSKLSEIISAKPEPVSQPEKPAVENGAAASTPAPQDSVLLSAERTSQPALSLQ